MIMLRLIHEHHPHLEFYASCGVFDLGARQGNTVEPVAFRLVLKKSFIVDF